MQRGRFARLTALACGVLLGFALQSSEAFAASWAPGVEASLPGDAQSNPNVTPNSVSCASAGNCGAVGYYLDSSNHQQGLLLSETAGTWATGVEASLPANAGSDPIVNLTSVSCASAGNCGAVGDYVDSTNRHQALPLREPAATWAPGVEASLPANAGSDPFVAPSSVSCAAAGNCGAVGTYFDSSTHQQGLLLSETAGTWATGVEASPPADAGSDPGPCPHSASCAAAGSCRAGGTY